MCRTFRVALRKESVDRNRMRRVLIHKEHIVALRKESVDRNSALLTSLLHIFSSLSARRAWIEILNVEILSALACVALRKESVDRNVDPDKDTLTDDGRSPQGERG